METKHTKGPWTLHPCYNGDPIEVGDSPDNWTAWTFSIGNGKTIVAEVCAHSTGGSGYPRPSTREEAYAIARLITAAPQLLELVEIALKDQMDLRLEFRNKWFVENAEEAIALATGSEVAK